MNLRLFFVVRAPRELDIPSHGRAISANEPITARNKEAAANCVADGDPKQVLSGAHVRQAIRMLGKKRQREYRHVRHRVLKAARDKSKKAPEDDEYFRGVIRGPRGRPQRQTDKPVAQHAARDHLDRVHAHFFAARS